MVEFQHKDPYTYICQSNSFKRSLIHKSTPHTVTVKNVYQSISTNISKILVSHCYRNAQQTLLYVASTRDNPVLEPLAVLQLVNRLCVKFQYATKIKIQLYISKGSNIVYIVKLLLSAGKMSPFSKLIIQIDQFLVRSNKIDHFIIKLFFLLSVKSKHLTL